MRTVKKELLNRIAVVLNLLPSANERQRALMESFSAQVKRRGRLSEKQVAALEKIETAVKSGDTSVANRIVALNVKRAKHPGVLLTVWQADFVSSLEGYVGSLSPAQENNLVKIEALFSDESVNQAENWEQNFTKEKADIWNAVMEYYKTTPYYSASRSRHFSAKAAGISYIPPKNEYEKVCESKYGKRIQAALFDEPRFAEKSLVAIRSNFNPGFNERRLLYTSKIKPNNLVFVVDNNTKKVYNACKGGKVYLVIGLGDTKPVEIEERYLKKAPKKKNNG